MTRLTPAESLRHTAGACRYASLVFAEGSPARQKFAPDLAAMAERFERRAAEAERGEQPDLFSHQQAA